MEGFRYIFQGVVDPRRSNNTTHDLVEMLTIALLATLTGRSSCNSFARFARAKIEFLRRFMTLKGGPPSHDAFSDLFNALDPEQLEAALALFAKQLLAALPDDQIAIDGKALRRAFADASERSPLHLVQAFAPGAGIVLAQAKVDGKSNELKAMPTLLEILELAGRIVTVDALHTQRDTSARIVEKGGDYVMPVKRNQATLHEDVKLWFSDPGSLKETLSYQHVDGGHGRVETRTATVSHDVEWLQDRHRWPGLKAIGMIEAVRELNGRTERSVRYFIMSREFTPERMLELVRNHWGIENRLHWVLDVVMDEDRMRNRTGNGPDCLAAIRRLALNIVRLADDKESLKGRMEMASWNDDYLLGLLRSAVDKF